jgi:sugar phosphate isomerase/epimerase
LKLGFDNFSIRASQWSASRILEYASGLQVDSVLFSDLEVYESFDPGYLSEIKGAARGYGLELQAGTGSICPSSVAFDARYGSAEERLRLLIRVASQVGASVARCYVGNSEDRRSPGGIQKHVRNTIQVLRAVRSEALGNGVTIAVENHAGDMQAHELVELIERAGTDFVGATVDSGNAAWTLEDPIDNLKILGPYAQSSGIRDTMVWETAEGASVQWTAMGEGCVDLNHYFEVYEKLCPSVPVQLEIISGLRRDFPYLQAEFWQPYSSVAGHSFARFIRLAKRGRPLPSVSWPRGERGRQLQARYQRQQLERSLRYCRASLGIGSEVNAG